MLRETLTEFPLLRQHRVGGLGGHTTRYHVLVLSVFYIASFGVQQAAIRRCGRMRTRPRLSVFKMIDVVSINVVARLLRRL